MKRLAAIALLALGPTAATAADGSVANNTSFGNWVLVCRAVTTQANECRLVQTLSRKTDNSLVVRFVAASLKDGGALLMAQVPMGAYLAAQPALRLAEPATAESRPFVWQQCMKDICEAARRMTSDEVAELTKAGKVLFGYKMRPDADPIVVPVSTEKLVDGLAAITPVDAK